MALYTPHSIFHLARLLYVRPETYGPYYVHQGRIWRSIKSTVITKSRKACRQINISSTRCSCWSKASGVWKMYSRLQSRSWTALLATYSGHDSHSAKCQALGCIKQALRYTRRAYVKHLFERSFLQVSTTPLIRNNWDERDIRTCRKSG